MADPFVLIPDADLSSGARVALPKDTEHHLRRVLRMADDDPVEVTDGRGHLALARLTPDGIVVGSEVATVPSPSPRLRVVQGLPKGRKIDEVIRTLTELGVERISPVHAERSVRELRGDKVDRERERWTSVADAACEQARRAHRPVVDAVATLPQVLERTTAPLLLAHVGASGSLREAFEDAAGAPEVVLAVGPEGGFSDDEVARCERAGARTVSLGRTVLRTEHAAPALVAIAAYALGRLEE